MSTQGRVGVSVPGPTEMPLDTAPRLLRKLEQKSDASPSRDAVAVTGTVDPTRAKGAPLTNGVTLAAGASVNLPHGLPRAATGFIPILLPGGGALSGLRNDSDQLSADMQKKFVRVTNTGGASVTFMIEVRP